MVKVMAYVPDRGDVVRLGFNPLAGHERAGRRSALVVSPESYNRKVGLALLCPITSQIKGYPFEVDLPDDLEVTGTVLTDQIKSLDWQARNVVFVCKIPQSVVVEALAKIRTLLE